MEENKKEELLRIIEKNSRIDLKELAVMVGVSEIDAVNALEEMKKDGIICAYHTLINWEKTSIEKVTARTRRRIMHITKETEAMTRTPIIFLIIELSSCLL